VIALAYEGGYVRVSWKGQEIGRLDYVSGGMLAGQLSYKGALFDTDDYSQYGVPDHWIEPKATRLCERQDRALARTRRASFDSRATRVAQDEEDGRSRKENPSVMLP
jgi:hypothetical protein